MAEPEVPNPTEALRAKLEQAIVAGQRRRDKAKREKARAQANAASYEPSIVSFIDVLGFRSLLASRSAAEIRDVILKLREFTAPDDTLAYGIKGKRLISRAFADSVSDAVVRVRVYETQHSDGAFFHEMLDLLHIQIQCIGSGVLIRAGVAIGEAHVGLDGKGPVFGPAMVRAVEIETGEAIFPRLAIDEAAYQRFLIDTRLHKEGHDPEEEARYVDRLLRLGDDGTRFIDYLAASESEFDDFGEYLEFLKTHAELVRDNLVRGHRPAVRRKYVWLARYHNEVVKTLRTEFKSGRRSVPAFEDEYGPNPLTYLETLRIRVRRGPISPHHNAI
jgi:hypothetical protein